MSEIEETLERIKTASGVEGFVIIDNKGQILRKHPDMSKEKAEQYGTLVKRIADKARHVVRDLEPENDLNFIRIRAQKHEILAAPGENYLVVVVQEWTPST
eukprot:CAMPEP_0196771406 /NCGR_PEP_ID=MMETSP1104-20130614/1671_1 /TAXON_ID=33652 /ORGANISM="Cafeteria sp., Strain Caron Lab Isolate" /LENGTH=100 /DNA_ID=CAMNT_0042141525 /DNA_START=10 /DNA_END=312 /DNA_ORIENTATION=-